MKKEYIPFVEELIELAIREDIGDGDHTSLPTIPADARGSNRTVSSPESKWRGWSSTGSTAAWPSTSG